MRVIFAGTPEFAVPSLQALLDAGSELVAVYTQPDRPSGRGRQLLPSPVKRLAVQHHIPVFQPESLRTVEAQAALQALAPDLLIVVAYGMILPKKVLRMPTHGCWNVHASLLPRWRGAAPIQRAIEAGDTETGVCLMQMEAGLDTGPVYAQLHAEILSNDTAQTLHDRLSELGAQLLPEALNLLREQRLPPAVAQSSEGIEYAHKLDKRESQLNFAHSAVKLAQQVRAFNPFPICTAPIAGESVQILAASAVMERGEQPLGSIVRTSKNSIDLACVDGLLRITELKRAGGKVIRAADYLNARPELKTAPRG